MDIGKEKPAIIVEPIKDPFRREEQPDEKRPAEPFPERVPDDVPA
jgi:hypothetical protein